jgi:MFS family permease
MWLEQSGGRSASGAGLLMLPCFAVATAVSLYAARRRRVWPLLVAGTAALTAGSASLLLVGSHTPLWALLGVSVLFGLQNGLNVTTNQTVMYRQAPAEQTGVAAGLMRSFMYVGAIGSASLIGLAFHGNATDHGLHTLAAYLTVGSAAVFAATVFDRNLRVSK